jgi:succinyl-CoA synthetase beta subunit
MDLYEYQGKELLRSVGIEIPEGRVATSPARAAAAAADLGGGVVVKAQVLTGGRGKAGGIKRAEEPEDAREAARHILGMNIGGLGVHRVLVEKAARMERELYAAVVFDRGAKKVLAMLSGRGGMEVEDLAREHPHAIARVYVDPLAGWSTYHGCRLLFEAGLEAELLRPVCDLFARLFEAFTRYEALLVEVNPLAVIGDRLVALDCKFTVDNNALFRHPHTAHMMDIHLADPQEVMARERGVTYVKIGGDVGILGNGAGLVMSTLDVVAEAGGAPANFLDVGGGAKEEEIVTALEVLTSDPVVRTILFNIFGGITRCDEVARGILTAIDRIGIKMPIVVRLEGTNEAEGRVIIAAAVAAGATNLFVEQTMRGAATRAVALARGVV